MSKKTKKFLSCHDVAERYGVQVNTVWEWIRRGKLQAIQTGKNYRIDSDDLQAFEAERKTQRRA